MRALPERDLLPLPVQPEGLAWPTTEWARAKPGEVGGDGSRLTALLDELVSPDEHPLFGRTYAAAVVARGRLVAERYGHRVVQDLRSLEPDPPYEQLGPDAEMLSWSIAKSLTSLAVGVAVGDGLLDVTDRVPEPLWADPADGRHDITWHDLLTMRPGLAWQEEYYDVEGSTLPDVLTMLFGEGADDMAAYAASRSLKYTPGSDEAFNYSSGTTNIIAANLQRVLGVDRAGMIQFLHERILDPIGMTGLRADFDPAGTFIGSSYAWATLTEWCRFGLLAIRGGIWDGQRIVPEGWIDYSRAARSWDEIVMHGAQWWAWDQNQMPFGAHGFEGQRIICFPARDVVVIRFGKSSPDRTSALNTRITDIASCFPVL